ncbi:hypothetical protein K470DRAFT_257438 [Piedraia hortae CBS 480.64]|uniref:GAR domain-containing protein n=1 Tax=Piedraia hortae CBS 480.64 TaxID=1314780 RepID=A0A6A7C1K2_9PEZI|nr:hypothetical protein K470DRAFT_257438 [Piedraia hortae CBS 480.64]
MSNISPTTDANPHSLSSRYSSLHRVSSRSVKRKARSGDELRNYNSLPVRKTLNAFTDSQPLVSAEKAEVTAADRAIADRAVQACDNLRSWCAELEEWKWPGCFVLPDCPSGDEEFWGSLPAHIVQHYDKRLDEICHGLDAIDVDELKQYALGARKPFNRFDNPGHGAAPILLDEFIAEFTATLLHILPYFSRLDQLVDMWTVRLSVLRRTPDFLRDLERAKVDLDNAWEAIVSPQTAGKGSNLGSFSREDMTELQRIIQQQVARLGRRVDGFLDALEGRDDVLPDIWIQKLEELENAYADWVVQAEKRVHENEWKVATDTGHDSTQEPLPQNLNDTYENDVESDHEHSNDLARLTDEAAQSGAISHAQSMDGNVKTAQGNFITDPSMPTSEETSISPISDCANSLEGSNPLRSVRSDDHLDSPTHSASPNVVSPVLLETMAAVQSCLDESRPCSGVKNLCSTSQRSANADESEHSPAETFHSKYTVSSLGSGSLYYEAQEESSPDGNIADAKVTLEENGADGNISPDIASDENVLHEVSVQDFAKQLRDDDNVEELSFTSIFKAPHLKLRIPGTASDEEINSAAQRALASNTGPSSPASSPSSYFGYNVQPDPSSPQSGKTSQNSPDNVQPTGKLAFPPLSRPIPKRNLATPSKKPTDTFDRHVLDVLETLPSHTITFEPRHNSELSAKPRAETLPTPRPKGLPRRTHLTLRPADSTPSRLAKHDSKLYHLSQTDKDEPIKLYVRIVGEDERVMVRVGGGWADLAEYLHQYAEHHGSRTVSSGTLELHSAESPRSVRRASPSGGSPIVIDTPGRATRPMSRRSNHTDVFLTPPQRMGESLGSDSPISTPRVRGSRPSTADGQRRLGEVSLAGQRSGGKRSNLGEQKAKWVEGMIEKAKAESSRLERKELGKVGRFSVRGTSGNWGT